MHASYLKTGLYALATTALLLGSSQNHAQQYYKWVDAKGSTHYTTTPPPKSAKRVDKIATYGSGSRTTVNQPATTQVAPQAAQNTASANSNTAQNTHTTSTTTTTETNTQQVPATRADAATAE